MPDCDYSICMLQELNNYKELSEFRVLSHIIILCGGVELLAIDTGSEVTCVGEEFNAFYKR